MTRTPVLHGPSVDLLRFALLEDISHGISSRRGGVSPRPYATLNLGHSTGDSEENVLENRRRFVSSLGTVLERVAVARLRHGREVTVIREGVPLGCAPTRAGSSQDELAFWSDAVVSDVSGLHLLLTFADCVPIVLADRSRGVVGAAHAGWRGTALGIAGALVGAMRAAFGSSSRDLVAGIGPSIGPCCYTVGREVLEAFHASGLRPALVKEGDVTRLDLWSSNAMQLEEAGVPRASIENLRICTGCNVSTFFSHRAEGGRTGRFGLCIGKV